MEGMGADDWQAVLLEDPGNPYFAEVSENLRKEGRYAEAYRVCFAGLSANPNCHVGRLALARLFYDQGFFPFAVRELEVLRSKLPENKTLLKLLMKLSPERVETPVASQVPETTLAEVEFDFREIDLLEEKNREEQD